VKFDFYPIAEAGSWILSEVIAGIRPRPNSESCAHAVILRRGGKVNRQVSPMPLPFDLNIIENSHFAQMTISFVYYDRCYICGKDLEPTEVARIENVRR